MTVEERACNVYEKLLSRQQKGREGEEQPVERQHMEIDGADEEQTVESIEEVSGKM